MVVLTGGCFETLLLCTAIDTRCLTVAVPRETSKLRLHVGNGKH